MAIGLLCFALLCLRFPLFPISSLFIYFSSLYSQITNGNKVYFGVHYHIMSISSFQIKLTQVKKKKKKKEYSDERGLAPQALNGGHHI